MYICHKCYIVVIARVCRRLGVSMDLQSDPGVREIVDRTAYQLCVDHFCRHYAAARISLSAPPVWA